MTGSIVKTCALLSLGFVFCTFIPNSYAHRQPDMEASFNLKHDADTATVTLRPSIRSDGTATFDYKLRITKRGSAGTSTEGHGGRIDTVEGKDVDLGPVLRFGSFAQHDNMQLELRICIPGSRCKHSGDVIATFSSSYPEADGAKN